MSHLAKLQVEGVRELTLDEMSSVSGGNLFGDLTGLLDKGLIPVVERGKEVALNLTDVVDDTVATVGVLVPQVI